MISPFWFYIKTRIYFGNEVLGKISCASQLGRKALIITGKHFVYSTGLLKKVEDRLKSVSLDYAVFSDVEENPSVVTVESATETFKKQECDFVIAIGGGSPMDCAKAVAVLSSNAPPLDKYFGDELVKNQPCPIVAVPTTSGTGSEVTRFAVIVDKSNNVKKTIASTSIIPDIAICDPTLTHSLGPYLTASTGMDALAHCVEGILCIRANPMTDMLNKEAIGIILRWLPVAVKNNDKSSRENMMLSSLIAGMALNHTGTMLGHGMGYTLTLDWNVPHGYASIIFLPAIISIIRNRYRQRVEFLDKTFGENSENAIKKLMEQIGLNPSIKNLGILEKDVQNLIMRITDTSRRSFRNIGFEFTTKDIKESIKKTMANKEKI